MARCICGKNHIFSSPKCKICGNPETSIIMGSDHICLSCGDKLVHMICAKCKGENSFFNDRCQTTVCRHCGANFNLNDTVEYAAKNIITK